MENDREGVGEAENERQRERGIHTSVSVQRGIKHWFQSICTQTVREKKQTRIDGFWDAQIDC